MILLKSLLNESKSDEINKMIQALKANPEFANVLLDGPTNEGVGKKLSLVALAVALVSSGLQAKSVANGTAEQASQIAPKVRQIASAMASKSSGDWSKVKENMPVDSVLKILGNPLVANGTKKGSRMMWIYDNGGHIYFENGVVVFAQAPIK